MCVGTALNVIVMSANNGMMPFKAPASSDWFMLTAGTVTDAAHITWYNTIRFAFLADWIRIDGGICSIGDLFLWFGEWFAPYGVGAWLALCWRDRKQNTR